MRSLFVFSLIATLKVVSHLFWRLEVSWVGDEPPRPWWRDVRIVAILNHTSLYELLFAGAVPFRFLWRIARIGVLPAAAKTIERPVIGLLFRSIAAHVVSITRERDHTWDEVLRRIGPQSMVLILPEGRMKRSTGLDSNGQPMTMRGGIADILRAIPAGQLLLAYSGGLHHVQAPGELLPRPFRTLRMRFELVDIASYRESIGAGDDAEEFKRRVKADLEARRDRVCPTLASA